MKKRILIHGLILSLMLGNAPAWAAMTSCEAIKDKISAKLEGKGIEHYTLQVAAKDAATTHRVVGSCEGGSKKVIYKKAGRAKKSGEQS